MKNNNRIIGVKIGSSSLIDNVGKIRRSVIEDLAKQTKELLNGGNSVFIVTSGAVASAKNDDWSKNLRSAIGQSRLMYIYSREFGKMGITVAQALLTDRELKKENSNFVVDLMKEAFFNGVVFIINANDAIDNKELNALEMCADNDKLFGLISEKIQSEVSIIVFSETGFKNDEGKLISTVNVEELEKIIVYAKGSSLIGHGSDGMKTKIKILCRLARKKSKAVLVSVLEKDFLLRAANEENMFGTRFIA